MSTKLPNPITAIRFRIEQYGWTDAQFAEKVGMSRSHFSEVMNGKRKMPLHAVRKAVGLGIPAKVMLQPFPCENHNHKKL
jgi:HTH-type transcriptional regulator/antitoxin HigA